MNGHEIAFAALALIGLLSAARVVTTDNVVHAALYLVVTLAVVGGVYLVLGAEFVAWVQVLIYVGAIVVLLLFSLMLTKAPIGRYVLDNHQRSLAALVALVGFAGLVWLVTDAFKGTEIGAPPTTTAAVGSAIFRHWVLPFEVVSVLLLAALVGAVVIARKDDEG